MNPNDSVPPARDVAFWQHFNLSIGFTRTSVTMGIDSGRDAERAGIECVADADSDDVGGGGSWLLNLKAYVVNAVIVRSRVESRESGEWHCTPEFRYLSSRER